MNARRAGLLAALLALGGWAGAEILGIATQPGGTSGQLEYNGGVFKGVPGSQVSGSTVTVGEIHASTAAFGAAPWVSTFTNKGALNMAANADITLSGTGKLNGPVTGNVTGNAATATALAATPSAAPSAFVCRGVDAQGNCLQAAVDAAGVASSTNPVQSGALASHVAATGSSVHGATSSNSASQLVARDGSGNFSAGTITAALSGNATTATALQAAPSLAPSGYVSRGVDVNGNVQRAAVDAAGVSSSTNPVQSGALYLHVNATGSSAHGATSANTPSQIVARDGSGNFSAGTVTASLSGNSTTATALAATPTKCASGNYPLGVDAQGNAQSCTAAGAGTITGSGTVGRVATFTGPTAIGSDSYITSVSTGVAISTNITLGNSLSTTTVSSYMAVSSETVNLAGIDVAGTSVYAVATDTVQITSSGLNPIDVACNGTASEIATNGGVCWSVLVDSKYVHGLSSSLGLGCDGGFAGSGWTSGQPSMFHRFPVGIITAGTHKYGFIFKGYSNGAVNLGQQNTTLVSIFNCWATEAH